MEEKTIGAFLSALRKSKGLTQRELAEILNVSDKAVSRWERDECAPDLTLIPVLAEIYDVTCDEILKGQRITKTKEEAPSVYVKSEKQLDRLLRKNRVNYLTWCIISVGALTGGFKTVHSLFAKLFYLLLHLLNLYLTHRLYSLHICL